MLAAQQLGARLARLGRLGAAPLPVVEFLPVGLLAAPQHRHGAPRLLHHLHDAVQGLWKEGVEVTQGFALEGPSQQLRQKQSDFPGFGIVMPKDTAAGSSTPPDCDPKSGEESATTFLQN